MRHIGFLVLTNVSGEGDYIRETNTGQAVCGNSVLAYNSSINLTQFQDKKLIKKKRAFSVELRFWNSLGLQAFSRPCDDEIVVFVASVGWANADQQTAGIMQGPEPTYCGQILSLPPTSSMALGKLPSLSESQFPVK